MRGDASGSRARGAAALPGGPFGVIYADPPWRWQAWGQRGQDRSAAKHYPTMTGPELAALPVAEAAGPDCSLFLWAVDPMLPQALDLMAAWGFSFKTVAFYWIKTRGGARADQLELWSDSRSCPKGLGYWTRANPEICLLGTRGRPGRAARDVERTIFAPRREHSRKPDQVADAIRRLTGDVARLELFARTRRPGWQVWGNELERFDEAAA
jgi:N6-adenosine-specific RNA methylase IME4